MRELANNDDYVSFVWTWNGHHYAMPVSPSDILTLARAVDGEGSPQLGVAWTLIQRAAWLRMHGNPVSLGKLVEQYAQPINPAWFPGGDKHEAELARLNRAGDIAGARKEVEKAQKRVLKSQKSWSELSDTTRRTIASVISGSSKSPVEGAVHYWMSRGPDFESNQAKRPMLKLLDRGYGFNNTNVFFAENGSEKFGGLTVAGNEHINVATMISPGGLIAGALLGFIAWKWLLA